MRAWFWDLPVKLVIYGCLCRGVWWRHLTFIPATHACQIDKGFNGINIDSLQFTKNISRKQNDLEKKFNIPFTKITQPHITCTFGNATIISSSRYIEIRFLQLTIFLRIDEKGFVIGFTWLSALSLEFFQSYWTFDKCHANNMRC